MQWIPQWICEEIRSPTQTGERKKSEDDDNKNKPLSTAKIPYVKGLSEEIRRILGQYKIRTVFRTTETLGPRPDPDESERFDSNRRKTRYCV